MNTIQLEQKIFQSTKGLSAEALKEILDFIQFIKSKKEKYNKYNNLSAELSFLDKESIDHLEEELADYKTQYPIE